MGNWAIKTPHCLMGKLFSERTGLYWNTLWGFPERMWRQSSQIDGGGTHCHKHRLRHRPLTPLELPSCAHLSAISSWFTCMNASPPSRPRISHVWSTQVGVHIGKCGGYAACMCLLAFILLPHICRNLSQLSPCFSLKTSCPSVCAGWGLIRAGGPEGKGGAYTTGGLGSASCQLPSSPHLPRTEDNATWLVAILSRSDFGSKF